MTKLRRKVMVPIGMTIAGSGMLYLTHLGSSANYAVHLLPPLMILGFGMGSTMPAAIQTATLGVDRRFADVASAPCRQAQRQRVRPVTASPTRRPLRSRSSPTDARRGARITPRSFSLL